MNFNKYFAFLAILILCILGQQATEAHHHHFGKVGHELDKGVKKATKVVDKVGKAKTVVEAGSAIAGAVAAAAA